jgi:hypothetical protein
MRAAPALSAALRGARRLGRGGPLAALLVMLWAPGCYSQPSATINPVMAKGPAAAPVTILEFSDYQ